MRRLVWILAVVMTAMAAMTMAGCGRSQGEYDRMLTEAEVLVNSRRADSAETVLQGIDVTELRHDSLRAKYHYVTALAHMRQNRSLIADSLIGKVHEYYRGKDVERDIQSGTMWAWYKFWVGDTRGAIAMLDSLATLEGVPDSLLVRPLRMRTLLGAAEYSGETNIPYAKRLLQAESDTMRKMEAKYVLVEAYEYAGKLDSALMLTDELIDYATANRWGDKQFVFEMERAQLLSEMGRYDESNAAIASIMSKLPGDDAHPIMYFIKALNSFNLGNVTSAKEHLAVADSMSSRSMDEKTSAYFQSYVRMLRTLIDYRERGHVGMTSIASVNNRQQERFNRMEASQWESERGALQQESRALALKAESEHKTVIILAISLVAIIIAGGAIWLIHKRRRRELESEERAEALQKMVDELQSAPAAQPDSGSKEALRHAMLQQLGIVKMVAETPTEQNREMLRRISSIGGDIGDNMVNWENLQGIIDNLYDNFHRNLHAQYGSQLSDKEEQIIILMVAGFSTKEIAVVTSQSAATIYVRKSSIRRKLGVPEKEDIVHWLHKNMTN